MSQNEIKSRIDQSRLSLQGYSRQLERADAGGLSADRQARLSNDLRLVTEEIATLEKIAPLWRVEPDQTKIEAIIRDRLGALRGRMGADNELSGFTEAERDASSGEIKALVWVLGEDVLTLTMREMVKGHEHGDPERTNREMPRILIHQLQEAPDLDTRASAAYDLGKLGIKEGIAPLASALEEGGFVAEMALRSLCLFEPDDLKAVALEPRVMSLIEDARKAT
ncbi:MAG: hypothetical protein M3014_15455 [Chloroflexota bacterium]|nr:hypothetical protein [Chloroflexota bacterium]